MTTANTLCTFRDQMLRLGNRMYRGCPLFYEGGTPAAQHAFNDIKEQLSDLQPPGFRFEYHGNLHKADAVIWGGPVPNGRLSEFEAIEKDFVEKANHRFAGQTHYQTVAEMIEGEMQHRLDAVVDDRQVDSLVKGISANDQMTIGLRIRADEKKAR